MLEPAAIRSPFAVPHSGPVQFNKQRPVKSVGVGVHHRPRLRIAVDDDGIGDGGQGRSGVIVCTPAAGMANVIGSGSMPAWPSRSMLAMALAQMIASRRLAGAAVERIRDDQAAQGGGKLRSVGRSGQRAASPSR